jgi:hypothetical protein
MSLEQFISNIPLHKEDKIRLSVNQLLPQLLDFFSRSKSMCFWLESEATGYASVSR